MGIIIARYSTGDIRTYRGEALEANIKLQQSKHKRFNMFEVLVTIAAP